MFSCLQILEAFLWFVLITLLNVTLIILTLSVSRLLNLLLRLVAFLLFLNLQCLASISRWITDRKSGSAGMPRPISYAVLCLKKKYRRGVRLRRAAASLGALSVRLSCPWSLWVLSIC